ncbi:MAG: hypothetical protein WAX89_01540 [Alphaproteobacteria bacterium]
MPQKWTHPQVMHIGRPALVYLPIPKVKNPLFGNGQHTPDEMFRQFCLATFNAVSINTATVEGYWRQADGLIVPDFHCQYRVSFRHAEPETGEAPFARLNQLVTFLSELCKTMQEDCIYAEFGEDAVLITPCA